MRQVVGERKVRCHKRAVEILRGAEARETRGVGSVATHRRKPRRMGESRSIAPPPLQKTQGWGTLSANGARKHC